MQGPLLKTFYDTVVAPAIFYGVVWWCSSISVADRMKLDKLMRKASFILRLPLKSVKVEERRMVDKLSSLMKNDGHPLCDTVLALSSAFRDRLIHPSCLKERLHSYLLLSTTKAALSDPTGNLLPQSLQSSSVSL